MSTVKKTAPKWRLSGGQPMPTRQKLECDINYGTRISIEAPDPATGRLGHASAYVCSPHTDGTTDVYAYRLAALPLLLAKLEAAAEAVREMIAEK